MRSPTTRTLRQRVFLTLLPLVALALGLGGAGTALLRHLGGLIDQILRENYASVVAMERLNESLERIDSSFQFAIAGQTAAAVLQYEAGWKAYGEHLRVEQGNITLPGEREAVDELVALTTRYRAQGDVFAARAADDPQRRRDYFERGGLLDVFQEIKLVSARIREMNQANMEAASHRAKATAAGSVTGLAVGLATAVVLGALLAWNTSRALLAPIQALTRSAVAVSLGNLEQSVRCEARDELGDLAQAFNHMVARLQASRDVVEQRTADLRKAEEKYRSIFENAVEGIFQSTPAGCYLTVNRALAQMLGYASGHDLMRCVQHIGEQIYADPERRLELKRRLAQEGVVRGFEVLCVRKDKSTVWLSFDTRAVRDEDGAVLFYEGFVSDVSERRRAEERLHQSNRAHRALSSCNHALVRASDELAWMRELCRLVVEEAGYRLCWVGRAEHDDARTVRPIASAGFDEGYLESARVSWADTERGRGPTGTCIRTGEAVRTKSIATDPLLAPWRAEALRRGYASTIAIPIVVDGKPFGALNIYATEPDAFADAEVVLLTELADDLAYGISALRTRVERNRALEDLRALNAELEQRVAVRTADLRAAHEREANIGSKIQQQLLLDEPPHDFPGVQVAALTVPSQRIAGDFYGFFGHEGQHCLDLIVADVMGKGVPSALLGAATKSQFPEALWHLMAASGQGELPEPQEIVTLAHTHMARQLIGIESFVTLCYARIDVARRRLVLVDCGHTGVLHLHRRTGLCDILHGENLPLGVREGEIYGQLSVPIEPEDLLVFYSDGVTEARDPGGEQFDVDRLVACVLQNAARGPEALVEAVREAVVAFSGARAPADDLTCVVAQITPYEAPSARAEIGIRSALGELHRAREFVEAFCRDLPDHPLGEEGVASLVLAVDEAAANAMKHAYRGRGDQRIDLTAEAFRDHVAIRLRYQGAPFDPSAIPPPSFDGSRESGFGVFMIAKSVDAVRYYEDDLRRSCIYLEKRREGAAQRASRHQARDG